MERQAGLHSRNSGKPTTTDGLAKPPAPRRPRRSGRAASRNRPGGQHRHTGATLLQTEHPDHFEAHLPAPQPLAVTEHKAYACRCGACSHVTRAAFPENMKAPVQYGPRIAALAVYLQTGHFLPEARLVELFGDLFQMRISTATLAGMAPQVA